MLSVGASSVHLAAAASALTPTAANPCDWSDQRVDGQRVWFLTFFDGAAASERSAAIRS